MDQVNHVVHWAVAVGGVAWQVDDPGEVVRGEHDLLCSSELLGYFFIYARVFDRNFIDEARGVEAGEGAILLEVLTDAVGAPVRVRKAENEFVFVPAVSWVWLMGLVGRRHFCTMRAAAAVSLLA